MPIKQDALAGLFEGTDSFDRTISPEARNELSGLLQDSPDPDGDRMRWANIAFLADRYQLAPDQASDQYEHLRSDYAEKVFKAKPDIDDRGFYTAVGARMKKDREQNVMLDEMVQKMFGTMRKGGTFMDAYSDVVTGAVADTRYDQANADAYSVFLKAQWDALKGAEQELEQPIAIVSEYFKLVRTGVPPDQQQLAVDLNKAAVGALATLSPEKAEFVADMAASRSLSTEADDIPLAGKGEMAIGRGLANVAEGAAFGLMELFGGDDPLFKQYVQPQRDAQLILDRRISGEVSPSKGNGYIEKGFLSFAESFPRTLASLHPVGLMTNGLAYKDELYQDFRGRGVEDSKAGNLATFAAVPYAAIDFLESKMIFGGKVPFANRILPEITSAAGLTTKSLAKRAAVYYGLNFGEQYVQEAAQEAIAPATLAVAKVFDETLPDSKFSETMKEFGAQTPTLLVSLGIFAVIGSGTATFRDRSEGLAFMQQERYLRAWGLHNYTIAEVLAAQTPEAAQAAIVAGWDSRTTGTPEQKAAVESLEAEHAEMARQLAAAEGEGMAAPTVGQEDVVDVKMSEVGRPLPPGTKFSIFGPDMVQPNGRRYVQVDFIENGENTRSTNPDTLREEGFAVPEIPQDAPLGQYTEDEVRTRISPVDKTGSVSYRIVRQPNGYDVFAPSGEHVGHANTPEIAGSMALEHVKTQEAFRAFGPLEPALTNDERLRQSLEGLQMLNAQLEAQETLSAEQAAEITQEAQQAIDENVAATEALIMEGGIAELDALDQPAVESDAKQSLIEKHEKAADAEIAKAKKIRSTDPRRGNRQRGATTLLDPKLWAALVVKGTKFITDGVTSFVAWSSQMIKAAGQGILPVLRSLFASSQAMAQRPIAQPGSAGTFRLGSPQTNQQLARGVTAPVRAAMAPLSSNTLLRLKRTVNENLPDSVRRLASSFSRPTKLEGFISHPAGKEWMQRVHATVTDAGMVAGRNLKTLEEAERKLKGIDKRWAREHFKEEYEKGGAAAMPNKRLKDFAEAWTRVHNDIGALAEQLEVQIADDRVAGGYRPFKRLIPNFYPRSFTREAHRALIRGKGPVFDALVQQAQLRGIDPRGLIEQSDITSGTKKNGHLESARIGNLPDTVTLPSGEVVRVLNADPFVDMENYVMSSAQRLGIIKNFGGAGETGQFAAQGVADELSVALKAGGFPVEGRVLDGMWATLNGNMAKADQKFLEEHGLATVLPTLENIARTAQLSLSTLSQVTMGWVPIAARAGALNVLRQAVRLAGSKIGLSAKTKAELDIARNMGAWAQNVLGHTYTTEDFAQATRAASTKLLGLTGFNASNRVINQLGSLAAIQQLGDSIHELRTNPNATDRRMLMKNFDFTDAEVTRMVNDGVDYQDVQKVANLATTDPKHEEAYRRMAQAAQRLTAKTNMFREPVTERPPWMSHRVARMFMAYLSMTRVMGNVLSDSLGEVRHGNVTPLVTLVVGGTLAGAAAKSLRDILYKRDNEVDEEQYGYLKKIIGWQLQAGIFGLAGSYSEDIYWSMKRGEMPLFGVPLLEWWWKNVVGMKKALDEGDAKEAYKAFAKGTPIVRALDAQLGGPLIEDAQSKGGGSSGGGPRQPKQPKQRQPKQPRQPN